MSTVVHAMADQLRQYATHFAPRDWCYTRDTGTLVQIRYDDADDSPLGRLAAAWRWLTRKPQDWEREFGVGRLAMARHALKRDDHMPDGVLDGGTILTHWEETGEYLQYVQPSVGALLADLMDAHPDLPEVQAVAAEMKRINDDYGARVGAEESCHCGRPVAFGFDGDPTHHRGMCEHCDSVRCDAYPGECDAS